jgi:hypothetical protein
MVDDQEYSELVEFMRKVLFQDVCELSEKVEEALICPDDYRAMIVGQARKVLASGYSEDEIDEFISRHTPYFCDRPSDLLREIARILEPKNLLD